MEDENLKHAEETKMLAHRYSIGTPLEADFKRTIGFKMIIVIRYYSDLDSIPLTINTKIRGHDQTLLFLWSVKEHGREPIGIQ